MDERGGLERLPGGFVRHFLRSELAQLFIDERQEFVRRVRVAPINALQNDGEFAHAEIITGFRGRIEEKIFANAGSIRKRTQCSRW